MTRFLSPEWMDAVNRLDVAIDPEARLTVAHRVSGAPHGEVAYVLRFADGRVRASLADGEAADHADVTFHEDYETAAALARGEITATQAVAAGRLKVSGDAQALGRHLDVFATLADAPSGLQPATTY